MCKIKFVPGVGGLQLQALTEYGDNILCHPFIGHMMFLMTHVNNMVTVGWKSVVGPECILLGIKWLKTTSAQHVPWQWFHHIPYEHKCLLLMPMDEAYHSLIYWVTCSYPVHVTFCRHTGTGRAWWLPWKHTNIFQEKFQEIVITWYYLSLFIHL